MHQTLLRWNTRIHLGFGTVLLVKYSSTSRKVVYANNFPLKGSRGSSIKGINNNGDIVGTYTLDNNEDLRLFCNDKRYENQGFRY